MDYLQIVIPAVIAFLITVVATPLIIPVLKRIKAGQSIREDGPQSHMVKSGTPTMGGVAIIGGVLITCLTSGETTRDMLVILGAFLAFGVLGFLDDFVKVTRKRNLGLTAKQKLILQILFAVILAVYQSHFSIYGTKILIPFLNENIDFGVWYIPFIAFVVVSMVNAVNLTDGLDGLASGVTLIVALFFAIIGSTYGSPTAALFLLRNSRSLFWFPDVQQASGEGLHGRYRISRAGRRDRRCGDHHERRADPAFRWRGLCGGGTFRHPAGCKFSRPEGKEFSGWRRFIIILNSAAGAK